MEFEEFYATSFPVLRRLAFARTGDWATAEDLVQDVLGDAHRRWDAIGCYDDTLAWGRRAILNRAASRWRALGREAGAMRRLAGRAPVAAAHEPGFSDELLWVAIRKLPRRQVEVVLMLWFEELTVIEAADLLGCGVETVRTHWRRARMRLCAELGVQVATAEHEGAGES